MAFKINISDKGKTKKYDIESESLIGQTIGSKINGKDIAPELEGYDLEITGTSDKSGFPGLPEQEGPQLRRVLLTYGRGMKQRPRKEGKKPTPNTKGLRLRKSVRGNEISEETVQINMKVIKQGKTKFEELFAPKQEENKEQENKEGQQQETQNKEEQKSEEKS